MRLGYTVRSPSRSAFHRLLEVASCGYVAEKGMAIGPPGVDLKGGLTVLQSL